LASKQEIEAERNLRLLFPDLLREVTIDKIIPSKTNSGIRVDIWVPSIRLVIEIHGIQHHKPSGFGSDKMTTKQKFIDQVSRDSRLMDICTQYDIAYEQIDYNGKTDFATLFRQFGKYCEEE
jgi:hypothetical protein